MGNNISECISGGKGDPDNSKIDLDCQKQIPSYLKPIKNHYLHSCQEKDLVKIPETNFFDSLIQNEPKLAKKASKPKNNYLGKLFKSEVRKSTGNFQS